MWSGAALHPLSAFLGDWFAAGVPGIDALNHEATRRGLQTGGGAPLRFVLPCAAHTASGAPGYERQAFEHGEICTRPDNPHDLFNALIWLAFPQAKAMLNRRHHEVLQRSGDTQRRGSLRDFLTQFDECGVIVAGMPDDMIAAMRAHRWSEVFVARRAELQRVSFVLFGHGSHDALRQPFIGLCGKALFLDVTNVTNLTLSALDVALAHRIASVDFSCSPRQLLQPLPLLGIPGATPDNEHPDYYANRQQFRPPRTMSAGSSPDSR